MLPIKSTKLFKVTDTHLHLPRASLSGCIRAYVSRSTIGIDLEPHEMLNHYPASPLLAMTWTIKGQGVLVSQGGVAQAHGPPAPITVSGPQTMPSVTDNAGAMHGFMVLFMPDAIQALTGIDVTQLVDRYLPMSQVFDTNWQDMALAVLYAPDERQRIQCLEAFLMPRWRTCQTGLVQGVPRYREWMTSLATRAALSGVGKSTRQAERRVKLWAGQSLQGLRGLARAESSFFDMRQASERDMLSWAELAFNAGFSDQAHMCREIRRITGFSPEEIRRAIETDESFWVYRLWQ